MTINPFVPKRFVLILAMTLALPLAACTGSGNAELAAPAQASAKNDAPGKSPELPNLLPLLEPNVSGPSTPHVVNPQKRPPLAIQPEVKAKWKAVELSMTPHGGKAQKSKVSVGRDIALRNSSSAVHVLAFVPAFQITSAGVTSRSNELDNPAVLLRLVEAGQPLAEGWVFQKMSEFNTFQSDKVQIQLLGATTK